MHVKKFLQLIRWDLEPSVAADVGRDPLNRVNGTAGSEKLYKSLNTSNPLVAHGSVLQVVDRWSLREICG